MDYDNILNALVGIRDNISDIINEIENKKLRAEDNYLVYPIGPGLFIADQLTVPVFLPYIKNEFYGINELNQVAEEMNKEGNDYGITVNSGAAGGEIDGKAYEYYYVSGPGKQVLREYLDRIKVEFAKVGITPILSRLNTEIGIELSQKGVIQMAKYSVSAGKFDGYNSEGILEKNIKYTEDFDTFDQAKAAAETCSGYDFTDIDKSDDGGKTWVPVP